MKMIRPIARETGIVLDVGEVIESARRIRNLDERALGPLSPAMLEAGARNLRAAAYSLTSAARTFEHAARNRRTTP